MSRLNDRKVRKIAGGKATPESAYMDRRRFLKGAGMIGLYSAALAAGCSPGTSGREADLPLELSAVEKTVYPARRNDRYLLDRPLTREEIAARYNNFYEFTEIKEDVRVHAQKLVIRPWAVEVTGLVRRPKTFDLDDLRKTMPMEERLYRHRCVEAWAMAVPWTGFPLKALLDAVQPLSSATHVRFKSFYKPFAAQGQLAFWYPWPYTEGLTLAEATNELAFMAVGIYGHPLPKQHGAPVRLVVPWKYGFKSIKSAVRIELVDYRPATFWNTAQGLEYDFAANVNPTVPHPRWSQAREKTIDTGETRPTLLYNGYEEYVGRLYA
ncbi:MAG: protein-methionine-sulfoxide reductase catalytic subunit MsrP [Nitrospinae bacterium]|nr:protein-methionine-sulfoxide reductase catalytic subunit MsrP [Nitrospinota bacterium]